MLYTLNVYAPQVNVRSEESFGARGSIPLRGMIFRIGKVASSEAQETLVACPDLQSYRDAIRGLRAAGWAVQSAQESLPDLEPAVCRTVLARAGQCVTIDYME